MSAQEAEPMPWPSPGPSLQKVCWWWLPLFMTHMASESEQEKRSSRAFIILTCLVMSLTHMRAHTHTHARMRSQVCSHPTLTHTPYSLHTQAVPHAHTHSHTCTLVHTDPSSPSAIRAARTPGHSTGHSVISCAWPLVSVRLCGSPLMRGFPALCLMCVRQTVIPTSPSAPFPMTPGLCCRTQHRLAC